MCFATFTIVQKVHLFFHACQKFCNTKITPELDSTTRDSLPLTGGSSWVSNRLNLGQITVCCITVAILANCFVRQPLLKAIVQLEGFAFPPGTIPNRKGMHSSCQLRQGCASSSVTHQGTAWPGQTKPYLCSQDSTPQAQLCPENPGFPPQNCNTVAAQYIYFTRLGLFVLEERRNSNYQTQFSFDTTKSTQSSASLKAFFGKKTRIVFTKTRQSNPTKGSVAPQQKGLSWQNRVLTFARFSVKTFWMIWDCTGPGQIWITLISG